MALDKIVIPENETPEEKEARLLKEKEEADAKLKADEEAAEEARKKAELNNDDPAQVANSIIIDEINYTIDVNGNALNEKGEIKFTKEQIAEMQDTDPANSDDDYVEAVSKASGIVITDDNGQPLKFESTIEGFAKRESAIKALGEKEGFNKGFNQFLKNNPDIASLVEYKQKFGTIEGYSTNIDYSKITITDNESELTDLIYKAEIQKGTSPERAKRIVEFAKANNCLKDDANESLEWLKKNQEYQIKEIQQKQEIEYAKEIEKEINFFGVSYEDNGTIKVHDAPGSLYDIVVNKGEIGEYSLPKEGIRIKTNKGERLLSREELFDYFSRPVKEIGDNVYSQAQLDEMIKLSNPSELALRFIMNLNGGIDQLIKATTVKHEIKRLKSLGIKGGKQNGNTKPQTSNTKDTVVLPIK